MAHSRVFRWWGSYLRCSWIDLDVLYGFVTYNLIRKPFLAVTGVKMAGIGARGFRILRDLRKFLTELLCFFGGTCFLLNQGIRYMYLKQTEKKNV